MFRQSLLRKTIPSIATGRFQSTSPPLHEFTLFVKFNRTFDPAGEIQRYLDHPRVSFFGQITEQETQWGTQKEQAWCLACMATNLENAKAIVGNDAVISKHVEKLEAWAFQTVHTSTL